METENQSTHLIAHSIFRFVFFNFKKNILLHLPHTQKVKQQPAHEQQINAMRRPSAFGLMYATLT